MCGIAGFVGGDWSRSADIGAVLQRMSVSLRHRGPDRSDQWRDRDAQVAFAHNRLAIIDVSAAGDQPMQSHSGRYVIVYNGEIYNHLAIRAELSEAGRAPNWSGHSDTETLLAAIDEWGVEQALARSNGMFAFAVWDRLERQLTLARDRVGEKPIYYANARDGAFVFGSELKALAQHPSFDREVDRDALTLLLRYGYIPAPFSIYRQARKLPPASVLTVRCGEEPRIVQYWCGTDIAEAGVHDPVHGDEEDLVDELERRLESAVRGQMVADVPLGAFLSGGIDSSAIVSTMQKLSRRPVKTFTMGFREAGYDEAPYASAVARKLGTEHTELYVTPEDARSVVPALPRMYDEPFGDSSQIPTHLVSALARGQVTVALSGDGGDELFGGYNRYLLTTRLWDRIAHVPPSMRSAIARAVTAVPPSMWDACGRTVSVALGVSRIERPGDKVHKGAALLGSNSVAEVYGGVLSLWRDPASVVLDSEEPPSQATGFVPALSGLNSVEKMMALDLVGYLPGDILVKVDRAAMAASLETRMPYLDRELMEFAWRLPFEFKLRGRQSKWILRRLLSRHLPRHLIDRPKMGFAVPIGEWLRGPLRDWAEALLDERRLRDQGYFQTEPIRSAWQAHLSGRANEQSRLWPLLMFQAWLQSPAQQSSA